ncbi:MAG: DUF4919 domain-containing protein [Bacteroidales bacterium]|nr:DUF4919 domain-containing protein [Bacteroidales bacterium]
MTKIIRPLFFVLLLCVANLPLKAQMGDKPLNVDYQKIEKFVQSQPDKFGALMTRFSAGDSSLTVEELATLYYGSFFSLDYDYEGASKELVDLKKQEDYKNAMDLCLKELEKSPCSIDLLFDAWLFANKLEQDNSLYALRLNQILSVILASGDGRAQKTAYKVVAVSDEYFIIYAVMGLNLRQQALVGNCDVMTVYEETAPDDTVDIWFDVTLHMSVLDKLFGGMDLNSGDKKAKKSGKKSKKQPQASLIFE